MSTYETTGPAGPTGPTGPTGPFAALADPTRRAVFEAVARRPQFVGELAGQLPVSRPAVSQHLKVLKEAGLVVDEQVGTRRLYRLNPAGVQELRAYVDRFWDLALAGFQETARAAERAGGDKERGMSEMIDQEIRKSVTVPVSQERAFAVFTEDLGSWWPLDGYHIGAQMPQTVIIEPHDGGRWYERAADGAECDWGRVLHWNPPSRLLLSWEINADWRPDPGIATEVEVRFVAEGPTTTRVELTHRGLASFGDRAGEMVEVFGSDHGWAALLARFAEAAGR